MAETIRIYLDEDVSVLVGEMLRARGIDVLTTRDAGNLGATDDEQFGYAITSGRVLLTHNRVDFEHIAVQYYEDHIANEQITIAYPGIIIAVRRPPRELTLRILVAMKGLSASYMSNQIRYV